MQHPAVSDKFIAPASRAYSRTGKAVGALVLLGVASILLSGCSFSAQIGPAANTVQPEALASLAADALENSIGRRPKMDCGDEPIEVRVGNLVVCTLTDPESKEQFDTDVKFTEVNGSKFSIDVQVAHSPR